VRKLRVSLPHLWRASIAEKFRNGQLCAWTRTNKTHCGPGLAAVNKWLSAPKLSTQPARAAFNPAHKVNIDLTSALPTTHWMKRRAREEKFLYAAVHRGWAAARPIAALTDSDTLFEQQSNIAQAPQRLRLSQPPAPGFALSW